MRVSYVLFCDQLQRWRPSATLYFIWNHSYTRCLIRLQTAFVYFEPKRVCFPLTYPNVWSLDKNDVSVLANFIDVDGRVFSFFRFTFDSEVSSEGFNHFFNVNKFGAGFHSLNVNGLEIITTNRDFDLDHVDLLKNDKIDIETKNDILAKKGVNARVKANLISDCKDYTFCRLVKQNMVYSKFEFEGIVSKDKSVLNTPLNDFELKSGIGFTDCSLKLVIEHQDEDVTAKLKLDGNVLVITEKDRAISLNTRFSFGSDPSDDIKITGRMLGIYDNVFKAGLIDLTNVEISGRLNKDSKIFDFSLNGLGIYGRNCYSNSDLIEALQTQDSNPVTRIIDLSGLDSDSDNSIPIIKNSCKTAHFKVFLDHEDFNKNHIRGVLNFKNSEDLFRTSLDLKSDDHAPKIINDIKFPYGLVLDFSYEQAIDDKPISFMGVMNFMDVDAQGQFDLYTLNNKAKVNIVLPTMKFGGGNFQFITHDDLFYHYGLQDDDSDHRNLDIVCEFEELKNNNTLKFMLEKDELAKTQLVLEANTLIFNMVNRTVTYLEDDLIAFSVVANPFIGIFEANTVVELNTSEGNLPGVDSVMKMEFTPNDEFMELERNTNSLLQEWVSRIIKVTEEATLLREQLDTKLSGLKKQFVPEDSCDVYEQCDNLPTIV